MAVTRKDPLPAFCFKVQMTLNGGVVGDSYFKSVSGLSYTTEVIPVREGGANNTTFQLPGSTKWDPIVLKQGFTGSSALLAWREQWIAGKPTVRITSGSIYQLNSQLQAVCHWTFFAGWPSKWSMSDFDASKSEVSIESLEITHHGLLFNG